METLFIYNSRMSFGLGARHLSILKNSKTGTYFARYGTPMNPGKKFEINLTEEQEKEIKTLTSCFENADYIRHVILR